MPDKGPIGVDLRMWAHPGIGRYIRELTGAMLRLQGAERFLFLALAGNEGDIFKSLGPVRCELTKAGIYGLAEQKELWDFSKRTALLHVPHFNAPLFCSSRLVVTVHDLIYLKEARFSGSVFGKLYVRAMLRGIEKNARAVIAVSDFTRNDLEAAFPGMKGRVAVIHEAASASFAPAAGALTSDALKEKFGIEKRYVLFVGSLKAHKNLPVLLDAFETLLREGKLEAELVVVGRKDPKERALLERLERSRAFARTLGERSDAELAELYRGAEALVIPSLWEGFGLTAVEGMASGTPVIASNRSSLPEVLGEAGWLFDPERVDQLVEILYNVLNDKNLRHELSKKGLERARCFSWESAARRTLETYERAMA